MTRQDLVIQRLSFWKLRTRTVCRTDTPNIMLDSTPNDTLDCYTTTTTSSILWCIVVYVTTTTSSLLWSAVVTSTTMHRSTTPPSNGILNRIPFHKPISMPAAMFVYIFRFPKAKYIAISGVSKGILFL